MGIKSCKSCSRAVGGVIICTALHTHRASAKAAPSHMRKHLALLNQASAIRI